VSYTFARGKDHFSLLVCISLPLAPSLSRPDLRFNATSPPFIAMDFVRLRYI